ncbi:DAK2 domain-containing protein [uncultured Roseobacter sp.]|uniref:DAK2 domain-containing protein n=1 Tax=uncultured Roseobacter sp. TaxID=114847 RepID=UPI00261D4D32|nr:DAK2 domain-containing protein [uncultured Roseobacter sp.]
MKDFLALCVTRFEALEQELNQLDAATGDGDHGSTILKGLRAAATADAAPEKAFRKAAGGASGSLFAQIVAALEKVANGAPIGEALTQAAEWITMLGQAQPGDKTMLDALIPAAAATTPDAAAQAAAAGRDATRDMPAKRGRARYVEGAGVGHIDAGAASVAELLAIFAEWRRM